MRYSRKVMGTGATIDIPGEWRHQIASAAKHAFSILEWVDEEFSPYIADSELSRYQRGEISEDKLSHPMKMVKMECEKYEKMTNGYFTAHFAGKFDPTGFVKGWAIKRAAKTIRSEHQFKNFFVGVGGDVLAVSDGSKEWKMGIQDPRDRLKTIKTISVSNGAVATSGNYERGPHIINPKTGRPAEDLLSVTVLGPNIIKADVFATAVFAMGRDADEFIKSQKDYEFIIIPK